MLETKRSPLKDKPLRLPGQSVAEEREDLLENAVLQPMMLAAFMILIALLDWWRDLMQLKPNPVISTIAAVVALGYAASRIYRSRMRLRNLRQALDGERAVGQYLERLREAGYHVFHDVVGTGFNIDHVLIGPAGVYTIETKTWSKPVKGGARVVFDGAELKVGGFEPDRSPVVQAKAQAGWMKSMLLESTGRRFDSSGDCFSRLVRGKRDGQL
ncbi:MAG: NERD domain-containing protein [Variovorax sp.]|nr:MAG: NERD domain-containing protein [Variovorax sp.]